MTRELDSSVAASRAVGRGGEGLTFIAVGDCDRRSFLVMDVRFEVGFEALLDRALRLARDPLVGALVVKSLSALLSVSLFTI